MLGNLLDNACKWAKSRITFERNANRRACSSSRWMTMGQAWRHLSEAWF